MKHRKSAASDQIVKNQRVTLLELVDRLLEKGVMVKGEVLLSVADIDLIYLNLGLLLSSVKTIEAAASSGAQKTRPFTWPVSPQAEVLDEPERAVERGHSALPSFTREARQSERGSEQTTARLLSSVIDDELDHMLAPKAAIDPQNVEKGLSKLVLTLVDLIRKLMEKQAIRRIESGQLSPEEMERLGTTFLLLDEQMGQIKTTFGLKDEDLHLDLGPLGELL